MKLVRQIRRTQFHIPYAETLPSISRLRVSQTLLDGRRQAFMGRKIKRQHERPPRRAAETSLSKQKFRKLNVVGMQTLRPLQAPGHHFSEASNPIETLLPLHFARTRDRVKLPFSAAAGKAALLSPTREALFPGGGSAAKKTRRFPPLLRRPVSISLSVYIGFSYVLREC